MRVRPSLLVLGSALLVAGCQKSPVSPSAASSWLNATVQGATLEGPVAGEYAGGGTFTTTPNARRPAAPALFLLQSQGVGAAAGEGFEVMRQGAEIPSPGRYELGAEGPGAFNVVYTQRRGRLTSRYAARSGELVITSASADRLVGTFAFTGTFAGTCETTSVGAVSCTHAGPPAADAPVLTASGAFDVSRAN